MLFYIRCIGIYDFSLLSPNKKVIETLNFVQDKHKIEEWFTASVKLSRRPRQRTCHEFMLRKIPSLGWRISAIKMLVVISDSIPHSPEHTTLHLKRNELLDNVARMNITISSSFMGSQEIPYYFGQLKEKTSGV